MSSPNSSEVQQRCGHNGSDSNYSYELMVFPMNGIPVPLNIKKRSSALSANDVLNEIYSNTKSELKYNPKYKELFSIWLSSPYLELQLKPSHRPIHLLSKWDLLLRKYGSKELMNEPILIEKDEPTLTFQRNVFCSQTLEMEITEEDMSALYLLYCEAKQNVLDGRYPIPHESNHSFERLAAFQAAIDSGLKYKVEDFRQNLKDFIPFNYIKSDGNKFNGLIRTLSRASASIRCAQHIYQNYEEIRKENLSKYKLLRSYLEICWRMPSYGSAYFSAQIEKPLKSKMNSLINHFDLEVWVAINQTGLHVISKEKPELLLSIDCIDICWAVGRPKSSDPNCIPCLYIQIPDQNDNILQIFSYQFALIETLLTSFIKDVKSLNSRSNSTSHSNHNLNEESYDVVDGTVFDGDECKRNVSKPLYSSQISQNSKIYKPEKLSLAKFNSSGQCINKTGSWVRSNRK